MSVDITQKGGDSLVATLLGRALTQAIDVRHLDGTEAVAEEEPFTVEPWRIALIVGLVTLSGCFSGLNLGVLGLETQNLEMLT